MMMLRKNALLSHWIWRYDRIGFVASIRQEVPQWWPKLSKGASKTVPSAYSKVHCRLPYRLCAIRWKNWILCLLLPSLGTDGAVTSSFGHIMRGWPHLKTLWRFVVRTMIIALRSSATERRWAQCKGDIRQMTHHQWGLKWIPILKQMRRAVVAEDWKSHEKQSLQNRVNYSSVLQCTCKIAFGEKCAFVNTGIGTGFFHTKLNLGRLYKGQMVGFWVDIG